MKVYFLPALYQPPSPWFPGGEKRAEQVESEIQYQHPEQPHWLMEQVRGTRGYYPHALIACPHWRGLEHLPFPKDGYLLGDSGGFSIATQGTRIDPRDVLNWQAAVPCTAGMILDVPPVDKTEGGIFEVGLEKTCRNVEIALPLYEKQLANNNPFRWWGVVQGHEYAELERWWEAISHVYPFLEGGEGWGFRPRPTTNAEGVAHALRFIRDHPTIKRAHFLATTSPEAVAVICSLGEEAGLDFASFDATSFSLDATNRIIQSAFGEWKIAERGTGEAGRRVLIENCECFSCESLRIDIENNPALVDGGWSGYWVFRFAYHNLLRVIGTVRTIQCWCEHDKGALAAILGPTRAAKIQKIFASGFKEPKAPPARGGLLRYL